MTDQSERARFWPRLLAVASAFVVAATLMFAAPAKASGGDPEPDYTDNPDCMRFQATFLCSFVGSVADDREIVTWEWYYPGYDPNTGAPVDYAYGESVALAFDLARADDWDGDLVTLTVTDEQGRTGSISKPFTIEICWPGEPGCGWD